MAVGPNNAYMDAHVPRKYRLLCKLCGDDSDSDDSIDPAVSGKVRRGKKPNIDYASEDLGDTDGHSDMPANHLQDLFDSDEDETEALQRQDKATGYDSDVEEEVQSAPRKRVTAFTVSLIPHLLTNANASLLNSQTPILLPEKGKTLLKSVPIVFYMVSAETRLSLPRRDH